MRSDNHLMADLAARGHALLFEPAARTAHVNVSRPRSFVVDTFNASRLYASVRREGWHPARRLLYLRGVAADPGGSARAHHCRYAPLGPRTP